jgi:type IV secretory pathway VirB10-like protein
MSVLARLPALKARLQRENRTRSGGLAVSLLTALVLISCGREERSAHLQKIEQKRVEVVPSAVTPPETVAPEPPVEPALRRNTNVQTFQFPLPTEPPRETGPQAEQRTEKLREQMERCLEFTVSKDTGVTVYNGQQVRIAARNRCDVSFSPADTWVEVRAISVVGSGLAGRQEGQFQTTIEPRGGAETILIVPCNPERPYRFEASVSSSAGGGKNAGE